MTETDARIARILQTTRVIALVGLSPKPERPSHEVGAFLADRGYRVIGVNPGIAGREMFGAPVAACVSEIDEAVDMVDIFRRSDAVRPVVERALAALPGLRTVWMQLGVIDEGSAALARAQGVEVVMDRCPKIEYPRLLENRDMK
jgi:predicted CoA-binding protein